MIFETQSTQSPQRTTALNERFQEEAKASSQRADAVFFDAQPLCAVPQAPLDRLCVLSNTLCTLCSQHGSVPSVSSVLKKLPTYFFIITKKIIKKYAGNNPNAQL